MDRTKLISVLQANQLCVISTINQEGRPESAVVGFTETPDLKMIIGTSSKSRKYHNILNNKSASIVVGWDNGITVQMEGEAVSTPVSEVLPHKQDMINKSPFNAKRFEDPDHTWIVFKPSWIRYTDIKSHPWHIEEEQIN